MIPGLRRLRLRLTAWYVGVFIVLILALAAVLFSVVERQISDHLDRSLAQAADALEQAAAIREREGPPGPGRVDALDELRIPDRSLYLFDVDGALLHPDTAAAFVIQAARRAARAGDAAILVEKDLPGGRTSRVFARRTRLPSGAWRIAVVAAPALEIDHEYPGLILGFAAAALLAVAAAGLGGWYLARGSIGPVEDSFARMRRFMADAAHELRTPVAVLKAHADLALKQPRRPEEYEQTLAAMRAEADRLSGILANLLTLARADAASWPERRESFFLDDVLLDAVGAARGLAAARDAKIEVAEFEELPVNGDPELLRQLFMIVLDNALKFGPEGGTVAVSARALDGRAAVTIDDAGPGVDSDDVPHVFERFYRADPARGRTAGAGLGLSIARWICDRHGGSISLGRRAEGGTRVRLTIPLEAS